MEGAMSERIGVGRGEGVTEGRGARRAECINKRALIFLPLLGY